MDNSHKQIHTLFLGILFYSYLKKQLMVRLTLSLIQNSKIFKEQEH
jgi:hypothetical protein